jgi:hypothetical protein
MDTDNILYDTLVKLERLNLKLDGVIPINFGLIAIELMGPMIMRPGNDSDIKRRENAKRRIYSKLQKLKKQGIIRSYQYLDHIVYATNKPDEIVNQKLMK